MALTKCTVWEKFAGDRGFFDIPYYGYTNATTFPSNKNAARFIYKDDNGTEHWILGNKCTNTNTQSYITVSNYEQTNTSPYLSNAKLILPGGFPQFATCIFNENSGSGTLTWNSSTLEVKGRSYSPSDFPDNTIPKKMIVVLQGGGGGGGASCTDGWDEGAGGGGGGGTIIGILTRPELTADTYIDYSIGVGGSGGTWTDSSISAHFNGSDGGETSIVLRDIDWDGAQEKPNIYATLTASGGGGGKASDNNTTYYGWGGSGGVANTSYDSGYYYPLLREQGQSGSGGGRSSTSATRQSLPEGQSTRTIEVNSTNYTLYRQYNYTTLTPGDEIGGIGGCSMFDKGGEQYGQQATFNNFVGEKGSGGAGSNATGAAHYDGFSGGNGFIEFWVFK